MLKSSKHDANTEWYLKLENVCSDLLFQMEAHCFSSNSLVLFNDLKQQQQLPGLVTHLLALIDWLLNHKRIKKDMLSAVKKKNKSCLPNVNGLRQ